MSKVTEFVALYRDLVVEFGQEELPEWAAPTADVIQRMATSLFIHENPAPYRGGGARPTGASTEAKEAKTIRGLLEDKSVKELEGGNVKYGVKIGGTWYSCFKKEVFKGRIFIKGTRVVAEVQPSKDGRFWNLLSIEHDNTILDESLEEESRDIPF